MEIDPDLVVDPTLSINEGAILPWSSGADYYEQLAQAIGEKYEIDLDVPWEDLVRGGPGAVPVRRRGRARVRLLPQPDGAPALLHGAARGRGHEPRAPLPGDRLRVLARADRGVHVGAAVPRVRRRAAAAGDPRRQGRRPRHPRVHAQVGARGDRVARRAEADAAPSSRSRADPEGDRRAAASSSTRRRRVPDARAGGGDAVGRRGAADPPGDADRLEPRGRALHPGRAVDRPAPARQPQAARHARAAARPRQHGDRRRARRGHDAGRRPHRGPRPGRGRARRPGRRPGLAGGGEAGVAVAHRPVPGRQAADPGAGRAAPAASAAIEILGADAAQPEEDRRRVPARRVLLRDRRVGLGQVHARQRDPVPRGRQPAAPGEAAARQAPQGDGHRQDRQDHQHRPVADRAHAALEPGHLHGRVRPHPRAVLAHAGGRAPAATSRGRFSFNVKGGRCEVCAGDGQIKIEMHFLPDVYVPCEQCHGKRYNRETLDIRFKGKTIADVLEMSVEEALEFFKNIPKIKRRLQTLHDVGLDYIRLGQPATHAVGRRGAARQAGLRAVARSRPARRSTSWTSRPPACTSPTCSACSRCSAGWSTRATPWS